MCADEIDTMRTKGTKQHAYKNLCVEWQMHSKSLYRCVGKCPEISTLTSSMVSDKAWLDG